ncbi:antibiotic biosynthesis monooxygenase family protein [Nodosilinea sp. AN01ver1]|uniref:antibiotic biosynthesis monooxygenase family protein n=1 Tax=Nodosilinea sp. AN01ver1 TaxID=3423362 RepID=UPI003D31F205
MIKGLAKFLGLCLLGLLLLPAAPGWADKAVEPLVFEANGGAIAVLSFYETDPATQADAVKSFYKTTKSFYKTIPGFLGLALFSSVDGVRAVELSQWTDQASYDAFQSSLVSGDGDSKDYEKYYEQYTQGGFKSGQGQAKTSVSLADPSLTTVFTIAEVVSPPGMVSAIPGSTALVQISDMATDTPEQQANLLTAAQAALATIPQLYPAPRTAILLKGIDTPHVALLTHWGSAAEFSDPGQVPQLVLDTAQPDEEAEAVAFTTESHLYQAIKVITPKAEYGKG